MNSYFLRHEHTLEKSHHLYAVVKRIRSLFISPLPLMCLSLVLSACAIGPQVKVQRVDDQHYQATTLVQVLYQNPIRHYHVIAHLSIQGVPGQSPSQLLAALQDQASELGAEAIIIKETNTQSPPSLIYSPSGGQFSSRNSKIVTTYHAIAIRFTRN